MKLITLATLITSALAIPVALDKRETHTGDGTYYYQNDTKGKCGQLHKDSDLIAAISKDYPGGVLPLCGKTVSIQYAGRPAVKATVADQCDGCAMDDIDMSIGLVKKVNPKWKADGRFQVTWTLS